MTRIEILLSRGGSTRRFMIPGTPGSAEIRVSAYNRGLFDHTGIPQHCEMSISQLAKILYTCVGLILAQRRRRWTNIEPA